MDADHPTSLRQRTKPSLMIELDIERDDIPNTRIDLFRTVLRCVRPRVSGHRP
jgi:hypothetical protein